VLVKATTQEAWEQDTPFVLNKQEVDLAKYCADDADGSVSHWILLVSNALRHPEVALCIRDIASLSLAPTHYRARLSGGAHGSNS
jgi:hypothetical protein